MLTIAVMDEVQTGANQSEEAGRAAGVITDVYVSKYGGGSLIVVPTLLGFGIIATAIGTLVLIYLFRGLLPPIAFPIALGIIITVGVWLVIRYAKRRAEREIAMLVASRSIEDLGELAVTACKYDLRIIPNVIPLALAKGLNAIGKANVTIRLRRLGAPARIEPLAVAFEPRILDESDSSFVQLENSTGSQGIVDSDLPMKAASDNESVRRLRRNVLLKGGWLLFGMGGFYALLAAMQSYQRGYISYRLLFWCSYLVILFFLPTSGFFSTLQWLIVPGGLVTRSARKRDITSKLQLFDRRSSTLVLMQQRRRVWIATVADSASSSTRQITDREANMLLRAWLSPVPPPAVEKLVDFQ